MKAQIVSFHCVLTDKMGKVLSSTFNREVVTDVPHAGDALKGLADGLRNLSKGEKREITLPAEQAYGLYDPELVISVPRRQLAQGKSLRSGQQVVVHSRNGEARTFRVTETAGTTVTLDGNHPLAGQDLVFHIEATEAREATRQELEEMNAPEVTPPRTGYLH